MKYATPKLALVGQTSAAILGEVSVARKIDSPISDLSPVVSETEW